MATLGDLLREPLRNGHSARSTTDANGIRTLTLTAVTKTEFSDRYTKITSADAARVDDLWLEPDDILIQRSNTPDLVGSAAIYNGDKGWAIFPDLLIRVRVNSLVLPKFLAFMLNSSRARRYFKENAKGLAGSMPKIDQSTIASFGVPVPPLAEQYRIVEALEARLSRLDAGNQGLNSALAWENPLRRSLLAQLRERAVHGGAKLAPLGSVAETQLGKMLDSKRNAGAETPYLRNINVRWGSFDLESVSTVPMPPEQREKFALAAGDLLVCEGGEPGRCAIWSGSTSLMAYQKALHRVRPLEGVTAEWIALMLEEAVRNGRTVRMLTGTTIKHLPQEKLRTLEIPVPSLDFQEQLVEDFSSAEIRLSRLHGSAESSVAASGRLRRALLARAFTGRLVPQHPADTPAATLLAQIQAERAAQAKPKQARKATAAAKPPKAPFSAPVPEPTPAPTTAVQQEFEL
jgi:type I restriction enzyme S subunit